MARDRAQRSRILTLERQLGFLTERGLSRTRSDLLPPEVLRMNASIDEIKNKYHTLTKEELVSSESFDQAWRDLLFELKCLWPESVEQRGCVLDPELYSQPLVFHKAEDFLKIEEYFCQLVMEKCVTFQRNQAAKPWRDKRNAEARAVKYNNSEDPEHQQQSPSDLPTSSHHIAPPTSTQNESDDTRSLNGSVSDSDTSYVDPNHERTADDLPFDTPTRQSARQPSVYWRPNVGVHRNNASKRLQEEHDATNRRSAKRNRTDEDHAVLTAQKNSLSPRDTPSADPETSTPVPQPSNAASSLIVKSKLPTARLALFAPSAIAAKALQAIDKGTNSLGTSNTLASAGLSSAAPVTVHGEAANRSPDQTTSAAVLPTGAPKVVHTQDRPGSVEETAINTETLVLQSQQPAPPHPKSAEREVRSPQAHLKEPINAGAYAPIAPSEADGAQRSPIELPSAAGQPDESVPTPMQKVTDQHHIRSRSNSCVQDSDAPLVSGMSARDVPVLSSPRRNDQLVPVASSSTASLALEQPNSASDLRPAPEKQLHPAASAINENEADNSNIQSAESLLSTSSLHRAIRNAFSQQQVVSTELSQPNISDKANSNSRDSHQSEALVEGRNLHHDQEIVERSPLRTTPAAEPSLSGLSANAQGPSLAPRAPDDLNASQQQNAQTMGKLVTSQLDQAFDFGSSTGDGQAAPANTLPPATPAEAPTTEASNDHILIPEASVQRISMPSTPTPSLLDAKATVPESSSGAVPSSDSHNSAAVPSVTQDLKPQSTPSLTADTSHVILVDWKHSDGRPTTVSRLTRYSPNLWQAVKADIPTSFTGNRFAGMKKSTVSMSAAEVLDQYGDSIASDGLEDCLEFLMNEAFGEDADVVRVWRKATITMKDCNT